MKHVILLCFLGFCTTLYSQNVVINLTPPDTVYIQVDSAYHEPGYTATSPNGDVTDSVKISTNLDTSALGIYTIEYFIADSGGNVVALQVRIVYVIDTIPPYLVLLGDSLINLNLGQTYIDPGYTLVENPHDTQGVLVVLSGDYVNSSQKGCYYICYQAEDQSGNKSKWLTRIIEVDNGCTSYDYNRCHPVPPTPAPSNVKEQQQLLSVKIYPNPASKEITVEGLAEYNEVWMEFFDLEGKIVARAEITDRTKVSVPECLAAGTYILRITADGKTLVRRQVIE